MPPKESKTDPSTSKVFMGKEEATCSQDKSTGRLVISCRVNPQPPPVFNPGPSGGAASQCWCDCLHRRPSADLFELAENRGQAVAAYLKGRGLWCTVDTEPDTTASDSSKSRRSTVTIRFAN